MDALDHLHMFNKIIVNGFDHELLSRLETLGVNKLLIDHILKDEKSLENRGLILDHKDNLFLILCKYGYEPVFLKYQSLFLVNQDNSVSKFKANVRASDIINLFYFDVKLRQIIFTAMQLFELKLKQALGVIVSMNISSSFKEYSKPEYFKEYYHFKDDNGKVLETAKRSWVRDKMKKIAAKEDKNILPIEVASKLTFRQNTYWYFLLSDQIREKIAEYLSLGLLIDQKNITKDSNYSLILDPIIRLYSGYRNQAAHEGIIYNYYDPNIRLNIGGMYFRSRKIILNKKQYQCGVGLIIFLSYLLGDDEIYTYLDHSVYNLVEKYLKNNPSQADLLKIMGLDLLCGIDDRFVELMKKHR